MHFFLTENINNFDNNVNKWGNASWQAVKWVHS